MFSLVALFNLSDCPDESRISLIVVPERYEMNAGKMGNTHGEKKDPAPARAEINMPESTMKIVILFEINTFVHIATRSIAKQKPS
jgi:hypothetical protein